MKSGPRLSTFASVGAALLLAGAASAAPAIDSITPTFGPAAGGIGLSLNGSGFGTTGSVTVDGVDCPQNVWRDDYIVCTLPPGSGTDVPVMVTVGGETSNTVSFSYLDVWLGSIDPTDWATTGGRDMSLTGAGFSTSGSVTIGGADCPPTYWSDTFISCAIPAGAGANHPVVVTVAGQASNSLSFSYWAPVLSSIDPTEAPAAGGWELSLFGYGFSTSGSATVGGVDCPPSYWSDDTILCTLPAGAGANVPVVVTVAGQVSNSVGFSYWAPVVSSIDPVTGPTVGGGVLELSGYSFSPSGSVTVDGVDCPTASWSDTLITCTIPPGSGANVPVVVDAGGQLSFPVSFSYLPPAISSIDPVEAPAAGGWSLSISGSNFSTSGSVTVDGVDCPTTSWSETLIVCTLPAGSGANVPVVVTVDGQASNSASFSYRPPSIDLLSPATGPTAGGIALTLTGSDFSTSGSVTVDGVDCPPTAWSDSEITCTLPAGSGADATVVVTVDGQVSNTESFSYLPPVISFIDPVDGPTAGNMGLSVYGSNFSTSGSVTVDGVDCPPTVWTDAGIGCTLPAGSGANVPVVVTVDGQVSNSVSFSYWAPVLSSIDPTETSAAGGWEMALSGYGFSTSGSVTIGGVDCPPNYWSDMLILCIIPPGAGANLPVVVTVDGQLSNSLSFSYWAPVLASIDPTEGPAAGGGELSLSGYSFSPSGSVTVDGVDCPPLSWSDTLITCTIPPGSGADVPVVVTAGGQVSNAVSFSYLPAVPALGAPALLALALALLAMGSAWRGR